MRHPISIFTAFAIFLTVLSAGSPLVGGAQTATAPHLDQNGWTVFTPSSDTHTIYVSNSVGNDANDGLSQGTPVKTIARGFSLLRHGFPDWLLFKKGDTWTDESFGNFCRSGRSATEPMLVSSYGTGSRPLFKTNPSTGGGGGIYTNGGGGCAGRGDYFALVGLEFYAYTRDPNSPNYNASTTAIGIHPGFSFLNGSNWMLIEDNKLTFYSNNVVQGFTGNFRNVSLRRNIIADDYSVNSHSQGLFSSNTNNFLIEENVWDHNGWNEQVYAAGQVMAGSTIYNRSMYLAFGDGNTTVRGNIDASGASGGVQVRTGGIAENNLFLRDPISVSFGSTGNPEIDVSGFIRNNVTLDSRDIHTQVQGSAIWIASVATTTQGKRSYVRNLEVYGNIVAHQEHGTGNISAIRMESSGGAPYINTNVHDNIVYNWSRPVWPNPNDHRGGGFNLDIPASSTDTVFQNNIIQQPNSGFIGGGGNYDGTASGLLRQNNTYWSAEVDPPTIWSKGWFSLNCCNAVSFAEWVSRTGEIGIIRQQVVFPDPNRTIDTYMTSLGLSGGYDAFMARARAQSKDTWDPRFTAATVNDYIRAGFGIAPLSSSPPTPTLPLVATTPTLPSGGGGTIMDTTPPTRVNNLSGTPLSPTQVSLSWDPAHDNQGTLYYHIKRDDALFYVTANTTFFESGLTPNTTYAYTVEAVDGGGNISPIVTVSVTTPPSSFPQTSTITTPSILATQPPPPATGTFPSLKGPFGIGYRNDQVKLLQEMLIKDGSLTGEATGYYGSLTIEAVQKFQAKHGITTSGTPGTTGYGLAGPGTRAKLNQLYQGSTSGGASMDQEAFIASLRKQVAELTAILQTLIAKLAALKAAQGVR